MLNILVLGKHTTYNIAGKETIEIRSLAKKIANIFKINFNVSKNNNVLPGSPHSISLSVKRYENEFGKISFTRINNGLMKTIHWHKLLMNSKSK
jgi:nucleoside-diphosphate-sugar epimerase